MIKHLEKIDDFDEIIKDEIIVDFYADWCGPCKMLANVLEETNLNILKVNVDDFQELAIRYGVMSIPTLIKFQNGEEVKKIIGFRTKEELEEEFK